jgi:NAD(P)H-hydrate epimerase
MRAIEAAADAAGYTYASLMEHAGRAAADRALHLLAEIATPKVTVLVGSGNNGGDGLVAGLLIAQGNPEALVRFYLLGPRPDDDPFLPVAREAELFIASATDDGDKRVLRNMIASADLVLDALFGIGVRLPLRDEAARVLRAVNQSINERRRALPEAIRLNPAQTGQIARPPRLYVLAIDCPSGLDCDTGAIDKNAIPADETITFIAAKPGLVTFPGAAAVGALRLANAGVPLDFKALRGETTWLVDSASVRERLPERGPDTHKGSFGRVLIVGGAVQYTGAVGLAALAAYRSGAGLVTAGVPRPVAASLAAHLLEATWLGLPHDAGVISKEATPIVMAELAQFSALLIGCGMGSEKTTADFLSALLQSQSDGRGVVKRALGFGNSPAADAAAAAPPPALPPLVLDADALNLLAGMPSWWEQLPAGTILTPHPGEMARLAKLETAAVQANRLALAREKAAAWGVILVLKGAHTLIATPAGEVAVLPFKTDALATAGTGDVLAGLIAGLLAQGLKPFEAAVVGGYVQGLAGTLAAAGQSSRSVIAGDVVQHIGAALNAIEAYDEDDSTLIFG